MKRLNFLAALLVILCANGLMAGGIIYNRTGTPITEITVSQCEFSSLSQGYGWGNWHSLSLSPNSVEFEEQETHADWKSSQYRHQYVVMKKGGAELQSFLEKQRELRKREGSKEQFYYSIEDKQFFLIDGSKDLDALQSQYAEQKDVVILDGYPQQLLRKNHYWDLANTAISIHSDYHEVLDKIRSESSQIRRKNKQARLKGTKCEPRHLITLKWGPRREPWISSIEPIS